MEPSELTRKTVNISMPPDMKDFVVRQAEKFHGENISLYLRKLIKADMDRAMAEADATESAVAA